MVNNWVNNINLFNPWHQNGQFRFSEDKWRKRKYFAEAERYLEKNLMISLVGLRRSGKTTIMRQLINSLLEKNNEPQKIFFYEFDEEISNLEEILDFYLRNILKKEPHIAKAWIFLDELQFVEGWQTVLKKYYDINPEIKFIISGSTHLYLHKNTRESLAGRIIDINIHLLSWHEFLNFKYGKQEDFLKNIFDDNFLEEIKRHSDIITLKGDFKTFLSYGEFPYFFQETDAADMDKYFKNSIVDKIFSKDIAFFDVENRRAFGELFRVLGNETAGELNLQNLAREIGLNAITIKRYLEILQKMFLHSLVYKYSKSMRKQIKSFKKGYVNSLNLLRASSAVNYWDIKNDFWGHIIETFVFNEFIRNEIENIFFYHDTKIKKEVDFLLVSGTKLLPIEVKASSKINDFDLGNLLYFMDKNSLQRGILLYGGDDIEIRKKDNMTIECIPFYLI